ncbi:MAG: corrinoid protein-associated methyltransferase CpaM, partial [Anaerolineae bacterium]
MATVFMKWLEANAADYDRGIRLLTLGRLTALQRTLVREFVAPGITVLEIGCGTGALAASMAEAGAEVTGIDSSEAMLAEARGRLGRTAVADRVKLAHMDATVVADHFDVGTFDLIVASLVLSELPSGERSHVLSACRRLLAPQGRLLVIDEVVPEGRLNRVAYRLVRWAMALVTWLLTRASTHVLSDLPQTLERTGYRSRRAASALAGSLVLVAAEAVPSSAALEALPPQVAGRLRHRVTLRTLLTDIWALFFRIIPPYPKVTPGLYAIGEPGPGDPVLVTGNFDLTVRRLLRALDRQVDCWLLVADSAGINVWCAAGGGFFTADKVIAAVKSSRLDEVVNHHALILPQLCANGVDGWRLRRELGWGVHWGPARARDIPAYLAGHRKKTDAMRWVDFPLPARLEMVTATLGFYGLLILVPLALVARPLFWPTLVAMLGLSYFYAVAEPWLPGRDGLSKSVPLALIALAGLAVYTRAWDPTSAASLFNRGLGIVALAVFTGAE